MGRYNRTLMDFDGEKTTFSVHVTDLNAGNIAAQIGLQAALGIAINDLVRGSLQKISYGNEVISELPAPLDTWAQREIKWLITYFDDVTGKKYRCELGTADLDYLDALNRDSIDFDNVDVIAFKTAFEDYVTAPDTDNSVTILSMVPVGRNT